jgi:hypothetical protein
MTGPIAFLVDVLTLPAVNQAVGLLVVAGIWALAGNELRISLKR